MPPGAVPGRNYWVLCEDVMKLLTMALLCFCLTAFLMDFPLFERVIFVLEIVFLSFLLGIDYLSGEKIL